MNGNEIRKRIAMILAIGVLLAGACAFLMILWNHGAFLPQWISWESKTITDQSEEYKIVLEQKEVNVFKEEETIWNSPEGVKVQNILSCDIDKDKQDELILLCWKIGRYGKNRPFWVEADERKWSQHIFVYEYSDKEIKPKWMSSYIGQDVVVMQENGKAAPDTRLWLTDTDGKTSSWMWDSWGFTKEDTEISFVAFGDVIVHEPIYRYGLQQEDGFAFLFENVQDIISDTDVSIINQETPLTDNPAMYGDYPRFGTPVEVGEAIVEAGFDVVTCATNHALDRGTEGIDFTKSFFDTNKITCLGIQSASETEEKPYEVIARNGIRFALLNYTYGTNGIAVSEKRPYTVHLLEDEDKIQRDIESARAEADFVVVFVHWGTENAKEIDGVQQKWAEIFLNSKVDVVIGTHPHVIQPYELLADESGHEMLIYYSLGNYISAQTEKECNKGGMAEFTIALTQDGYRITEYDLQPLVIEWHNGGKYVVTVQ